MVIALAFAGTSLAFVGARNARTFLIAAAVAGLVTAMPRWIPSGVVLGAAALILGNAEPTRTPDSPRGRADLRKC